MVGNDRLYDPLLDYRQISFCVSINDQDFELAILSFNFSGTTLFYTIFKPTEYNHIIHMSPITEMWKVAKNDFSQIFNEVCSYNNLNIEDFQDIVSFIS
jgi:hypothetical protein